MKISIGAEKVFREIFELGSDQTLLGEGRGYVPVPTLSQVLDFCEVLSKEGSEEYIQRFLKNNVEFVKHSMGSRGDTDIAVLFKPAIGSRYNADFAILQVNQGGAGVHLVEIESSFKSIFNKNGSASKILSSAIKQVEEWKILIDSAPIYHGRDFLNLAIRSEFYKDRKSDSIGVRFMSVDEIDRIWSAFGGHEIVYYSYTIILGRWSKLNNMEKNRFAMKSNSSFFKMISFEQFVRNSNVRFDRGDF